MNSKLPAPSGIFEFHVRRTFLVTCLVASLACAHDSQGGTPTRGVLVSMTRITVTPTPENNPSVTWDASARESQGGEGCGLLVALDFVAAPLGGVASAVCSMASSGGGGSERAQQDPDLFVRIRAGSTTYSSPVISDRASHDLVYSLFIPREALRDDGLELGIYDLDGDDERQSMLIADVSLREHQLDGRLELRGKDLDEPSLALLRLDFDDPPRSSQHNLSMSADDGLVPVRGLELAAGMAVEIRASGRYRIGSWNDAMLGPAGYPNGGPREYNLPGQARVSPFWSRGVVAAADLERGRELITPARCRWAITPTDGKRVERTPPEGAPWPTLSFARFSVGWKSSHQPSPNLGSATRSSSWSGGSKREVRTPSRKPWLRPG